MNSANFKDMTGQRYGRLVVLERAENDRHGNAMWLCQCDCGHKKIAMGQSLRAGKTKSCGCLLSESSKKRLSKIVTNHGYSGTKIYSVYRAMIERCTKPQNKAFKNYGGRGITVCDEWMKDRERFFKWAVANGYKEGLQLDRIDVNGNYCPENCRFVTNKVNANNLRKNIKLEFGGETHTLSEWADITGISYTTIYQRFKEGKPAAEIFSRKNLKTGELLPEQGDK